jgi:hypothetical protein
MAARLAQEEPGIIGATADLVAGDYGARLA